MRDRWQHWRGRPTSLPEECCGLDRIVLPGREPPGQQRVQQAAEGIDVSGWRHWLASLQPLGRHEADGLAQLQQRPRLPKRIGRQQPQRIARQRMLEQSQWQRGIVLRNRPHHVGE